MICKPTSGLCFCYLPGDPEKGVSGGVEDPGSWLGNRPPDGEDIEGGEAGEDGPPLEVPGGFMRFSFCRLLMNIMKKKLQSPDSFRSH